MHPRREGIDQSLNFFQLANTKQHFERRCRSHISVHATVDYSIWGSAIHVSLSPMMETCREKSKSIKTTNHTTYSHIPPFSTLTLTIVGLGDAGCILEAAEDMMIYFCEPLADPGVFGVVGVLTRDVPAPADILSKGKQK